MNSRSLWTVVAGVLVTVIASTLIDQLLHFVGFYPPAAQPLDDLRSLVATSYRALVTMGPHWYPIALAVLALPECRIGGRLFERRRGTAA